MPRIMPRLDRVFDAEADRAVALARAGEAIRLSALPGTLAYRELHWGRVEDLYELACLRVFIRWEMLLEESFIRYMCGYQSRKGQMIMSGGVPYYRTLGDAMAAMVGPPPKTYALWYKPAQVIARARKHFTGGVHEAVIAAAKPELDAFAAIRNRVAHGQEDAKSKFDTATMDLNGKRYAESRAGRFLREWDTGVFPNVRWLDSIAAKLKDLGGLIV
jgi:hypothetical protein